MLMPFGKHKGKEIEKIPRKYLRWLKDNTDLYGALAVEVERILSFLPVSRAQARPFNVHLAGLEIEDIVRQTD